MNKILWITDYILSERLGGAEIDDNKLIAYLTLNKINVEILSLKEIKAMPSSSRLRINNWVGKIVLSNISQIYKINPSLISEILISKDYIKVEHGHAWLDNLIPDNVIIDIFARAKGIVFFSPGQLVNHSEKGINTKNAIIVPPPFDRDQFYNTNTPALFGSGIYAGFISKKKGILNIFKFALENKQYKIDLFGPVEEKELLVDMPTNVKYKGTVRPEEMLELYNQYTFAIHLPVIYESFSRFVAEAYLCGLEIKHNDNIGFFSYPWDFNEPDIVLDELIRGKEDFLYYIQSKFNLKS